jgi:hypothetical protein
MVQVIETTWTQTAVVPKAQSKTNMVRLRHSLIIYSPMIYLIFFPTSYLCTRKNTNK